VAILTNLTLAGSGEESVEAEPTADDDYAGGPVIDPPVADTTDAGGGADGPTVSEGRARRQSVLVYGVLPLLVMALAMGAGLLKYWDSSARASQIARVESVETAKESVVAMLSYQPETVEAELAAAQGRLIGDFRDSYADLTRDVVIPGAKQKRISTIAHVPAAASVSATPGRAVVLVFVNQSAVVGSDAPTDTASTIRVTLEKVDGSWLISGFDPI
jgi:Mce-associated membrane protein